MLIKINDSTLKICNLDDICKFNDGSQCASCQQSGKVSIVTAEQLVAIREELANKLARFETQVINDRQKITNQIATHNELIDNAIVAGIILPR